MPREYAPSRCAFMHGREGELLACLGPEERPQTLIQGLPPTQRDLMVEEVAWLGTWAHTPQTQQRLFFSIWNHSSSSFAIENNWVRPHPPERSSKIGIWIEKFRCQNSNLNLPTIKNGFYGYSYLKYPLRIMKRI